MKPIHLGFENFIYILEKFLDCIVCVFLTFIIYSSFVLLLNKEFVMVSLFYALVKK